MSMSFVAAEEAEAREKYWLWHGGEYTYVDGGCSHQ